MKIDRKDNKTHEEVAGSNKYGDLPRFFLHSVHKSFLFGGLFEMSWALHFHQFFWGAAEKNKLGKKKNRTICVMTFAP